MIIFEDDLTKYRNDKEFYNLEYLEFQKSQWKKHYNYLLSKNFRSIKKIEFQSQQLTKARKQLDIIQNLIQLL